MLNPFIQKLGRRFVLSGAEEKALTGASERLRDVQARTALILEGDVPDHVHLIQKGFACRYKVLPDGGRSIVAFLIPGDFCDLNVSILGRMDHCIGAISSCDVVRIPRSVMNELSGNYPILSRALQWAGLVDEAILREWLVCMGRRSADKQVAHLFCEFLIRLQEVGLATENSYHFPLTQADLGDATGLSNVHVNRVLQELRGLKLVVFKERRVTLPNVAAIQSYAGFNPNYLHLHPKAPPYPAM
jgi:CRP-like cAMP-binding protein